MINRHKLKDGVIQWLSEQHFDFHLTFTFNASRHLTLDYARIKLRRWSCLVLRHLFGRRYYRLDQNHTLFYVAFPEYGTGGDNLHLHAPCRVDVTRLKQFQIIAALFWKQVVPSGSLYLQPISESPGNLLRVIGYDTKDYRPNTEYILSLDFAPAK